MSRSKFSSLLLPCAAGLLLLSLGWLAVVSAATAVGFLIVDRGGASWTTQGGSGAVLVGYGRIQPDAGSTTPSGLAIFGLRQNGILVTETGVPASPLTTSGRIYAERISSVNTSVNTGVAMANPNNQGALVNFFFTDINGNNFGAGSFTLPANGQRAAFLNEAPFNGGEIINGSFTYSSSLPISAVAIRGLNNERGEFLLTTLPVVPLVAVVGETLLISHFADGGGWTTQIILVNPTDESISGAIQFLGQGSATTSAQAVVVSIGGQSNSTFSYTIPPRSSRSLPTLGQGTVTRAGSVRITPLANQKTPAGLSVFSFRQAGVVVTEAGVPTLRATTAFRMYAEAAQVGGIQTGVAVANNSSSPVAVNFELTTLSGASTGLSGTETIGGNGQVAKFLNEIEGFGSLAPPFQGILRISTASASGVSVVGLRGRTNERGDFLITTTPPADETLAASNAELDFPHFVDNGGYTTQFILFSSTAPPAAAGIFGRFHATAPLNGTLRFFNQSGQPADLNLGTAPDLAISKSHTGSFTAGANGVYTIQILNVGVGATSGAITVTDTLPAGMSFVSATGPGWNCSAAGATVTCVNAGPMAPAASSTLTLTVAVSAAASGTLTNTVSVSNSSDGNPANNSSSDPTGVGTGADMSLTKSDSPDPGFVGADLTYTVAIRNNGPATATGVVVTDPLPPGVTFVSATPVLPATCSFSGGTVTCDFGSISNGDTKLVQIVVRPTAAGTLTNTATVTRNESDPVSNNNSSTTTTTVNAASADLSVSQTGPPTCSIIGNNCNGVTYSVTVTNNGPGPASAVVLTDTLPIDPPSGATVVTLVSATAGQGTCSGVSGGVFSCNLGTLNSGASTTVAVVVNVDSTAIGRTVTNSVSVSSAATDPNTANNTSNFSHAVTPFLPETDLEVTTLTDSPDPVNLGSNLTYTATVINKGRSTATGVIVTDTLPAGVTFVSATSTQGSCSFAGGTVTCTLGTLLKNVSRTISIVITPTTVGAKSNAVGISGNSGENDPVGGNNSLNVSTTVVDDYTPPAVAFASASSSGAESVTPASLVVNLSNAAVATATVNYAVTGGTATGGDYTLAGGALTFAPGETSKAISATIGNDVLDEPDETVVVTLSSPSANITLGSTTSHTYTIVDDDGAPTVAFASASSSGAESVTPASFVVNLSGPAVATATVNYAVTGGTATGGDYTLASGTVTFAAGETSKNIPATIVNDTLDEPDETVVVTLSSPSANITLGGTTSHTYTIVDDDAAPTVAFASASSSGAESVTPASFVVNLSGPAVATATVNYAVTGGTATGGDYTLASGTVTFAAGETSKNIPATIVNDTLDEPDETVVVTLSSPSANITLGGTTSHTYTIVDDDAAPTVAFASASSSGAESVTPVNLVVNLSNAAVATATVNYAVTGGTATGSGGDYTLASGTLTFAAGETSKNISATIVNDALDEPDETVVVTLSSPSANITLGSTTSHTYTIVDNDPAPTVAFASASSSGAESVSPANLVVNLSNAAVATATVNYAVTGGTATGGGTDYTLAGGTLTFAAGETSKNISVTIVNDALDEPDETVLVTLSSPSANITLGGATSHTYTIVDNDEASANLSVSKTGPFSCSISGTACTDVEYTVTISNSGPQAATGVVFTDTLPLDPAGSGATIATLKSATPSQGGPCGAVSGGAFSCNLGTIANGGSATVIVVVDIDATAQGRSVTNNASVAATSSDPVTTNNASSYTHLVFPGGIDSDMAVTMIGPNNVAVGANATYTATVTNNGPSTATGVILANGTLPAGATHISGSWSGGTCTVGAGSTLTCNLGTMIRTATKVVTIVVQYSSVGSKNYQVTVTRNDNDPEAGNNTAAKVTVVP